MSSVRRIAREAGVSITTVSRALNDSPAVSSKTKAHILAIANRSGYQPATVRRPSKQVGLAYTSERTLAHPYDSAVLEGIADGLEDYGLDLLVLNLQRDKRADETFSQYFTRRNVRGVLLRTMADSRQRCVEIANEGFPHVVISERFEEPNVNYIDCDSKRDSVQAVEYLILLGHRRIAFGMHNRGDRDHFDRFEGYKDALRKHDIAYDERLVFRQPFTLAGGETICKLLMSMPDRPTAVYLADPLMGVGAMRTAHELGVRVPEDLSIVGFDDTNVRFGVYPTMTAVCQDARALGVEAASRLACGISEAAELRIRTTVPSFFEVCDSTGPPGNGQAVVSPGRVPGQASSAASRILPAESEEPSEK